MGEREVSLAISTLEAYRYSDFFSPPLDSSNHVFPLESVSESRRKLKFFTMFLLPIKKKRKVYQPGLSVICAG